MATKILLLYGKTKRTRLLDFLNHNKKYKVFTTNKKLKLDDIKNFNCIISYGYRYKIDEKVLKKNNNFINLHISFLPFNKGAHPNFWSFMENTPSGVTIHKIDKGLDTGRIIKQKLIDFDILKNKTKLTFSNTYQNLILEIENLFFENSKTLINNDYMSFKQVGKGTFHNETELPKVLRNWGQNIYKTRQKFNTQQEKIIREKLKILDEIEATRKSNNVNWMNIIRNGIKISTNQTLDILRMINNDDNKISRLFKILNEK